MVARNEAINKAKGEYILPVDSDDIIKPTYIEKALKVMSKNPNISIVYCEAEFIGAKTGKWELPEYSLKEILKDNCIFVTALFRKRDWIIVGGYKEYFANSTEDYDFWLSFIEMGAEVYRIPEILFQYRIRECSRSTKALYDKRAIIKAHDAIYSQNIDLLERGDLKKYIKNKLMEKTTFKYKLKCIVAYILLRIHCINKLPKEYFK